MNLYQTQHELYCGIDLHANQMYACVVDAAGKKQLHRNYKTQQAERFFEELNRFPGDLVVGCESTFNWYWLADTCTEKKIPFVLISSGENQTPPHNGRIGHADSVTTLGIYAIPFSFAEGLRRNCASEKGGVRKKCHVRMALPVFSDRAGAALRRHA